MITCTNCETMHISESALVCSDCGTFIHLPTEPDIRKNLVRK